MPAITRMLSRRRLVQRALRLTVMGGLGAAGLLTYAQEVEPHWIELREVEIPLRRLPAAFHGYRIAQISDIHLEHWRDRSRLSDVMDVVNQQQPDLIVVTGDYISYSVAQVADELDRSLRRLRARDGVMGVMGNHDHWDGNEMLGDLLQGAGLVELKNDVRTIERGREILTIAGVDDVWKGKHRLDRVLERLPNEGAVIMLAHEPDYADVTAATGRFDLQLSGHSHGGQCVVPLVGAPVLPPLARTYPSGRYQVGGMVQYTNRGLGMVGFYVPQVPYVRPRVRLNCRPEVTLLTLRAGG